MTDHILEAYREDIAIRRKDNQVLGVPEQADGYKVRAHEISPGTVYKDHNVTVKAFLVNQLYEGKVLIGHDLDVF